MFSNRSLFLVLSITFSNLALAAPPKGPYPFFDAAVCSPAFDGVDSAFYDSAEKITKADTSLIGYDVYKLPHPITKDGFTSNAVVYASSSYGVIVDGLQADALAARYKLAREKPNYLLRANVTKSFSRPLDKQQQPVPAFGRVSIVALESPMFPGKTLLECELVLTTDLEAAKSAEGKSSP